MEELDSDIVFSEACECIRETLGAARICGWLWLMLDPTSHRISSVRLIDSINYMY